MPCRTTVNALHGSQERACFRVDRGASCVAQVDPTPIGSLPEWRPLPLDTALRLLQFRWNVRVYEESKGWISTL